MAKDDKAPEMVSVPLALIQSLTARLEALEHAARIQAEVEARRGPVLDQNFEAWKIEASRPAKVRTQDIADKKYGTGRPRFRVRLDSTTEDGRPGPNVSEHPEILISANSDLEAQARWQELCGIRMTSYRIVAEPVPA